MLHCSSCMKRASMTRFIKIGLASSGCKYRQPQFDQIALDCGKRVLASTSSSHSDPRIPHFPIPRCTQVCCHRGNLGTCLAGLTPVDDRPGHAKIIRPRSSLNADGVIPGSQKTRANMAQPDSPSLRAAWGWSETRATDGFPINNDGLNALNTLHLYSKPHKGLVG